MKKTRWGLPLTIKTPVSAEEAIEQVEESIPEPVQPKSENLCECGKVAMNGSHQCYPCAHRS